MKPLFAIALLAAVLAVPASAGHNETTRGQYPGTSAADNATAGSVGEVVQTTVVTGSAVSLTSGTAANVGAGISLTAGDWDVTACGYFNYAATTSVTNRRVSISQTSATLDLTAGRWAGQQTAAQVPTAAFPDGICVAPTRFSFSSTTTVFLVMSATFTVSTTSAWGTIRARRMR